MRIVFFGTGAFAVPSLRQLAARGHDLPLCVTQPDRPQGRGLASLPSPVKRAATALNLPIDESADLINSLERWRQLQPDLGVVIAYGRILPKPLLALPRHGMLGVHPSRLPKYRGANPIARAILAGERETAVTVFRLTERMDDGDIVLQRDAAIDAAETTESLSERLAREGAELLAEAVDQIAQGTATFRPQDGRQATIAGKFSKADGRIDWRKPAAAIERLIRAAAPWPGAHTSWRGTPLKLLRARVEPTPPCAQGPPGTVLAVSPDGIAVLTGDQCLVIDALQPAGGRRMTVREFVAGRRVNIGDTFSSEPHGIDA